jgi:hypothetical protein
VAANLNTVAVAAETSETNQAFHRYSKKLFDRGRRTGTIPWDIPTNLIIEILLGTNRAIVDWLKLVELGLTPKAAYSGVLRIVLEGEVVRSRRTIT